MFLVTTLKQVHITGAIFAAIIGTLLHFVYSWSGNNNFIGIFAPVNESVWEHLKLAFWPMIIFSFYEFRMYGSFLENFWIAKFVCIFTMMATIVVVFYGYSSILGHSFLPIDILTFYISIVLGYYFSFKLLLLKAINGNLEILGICMVMFLVILFTYFTFSTPRYDIFKDSPTGTYGIFKK